MKFERRKEVVVVLNVWRFIPLPPLDINLDHSAAAVFASNRNEKPNYNNK